MSNIEGLSFSIRKKKYNSIDKKLYYVPNFLLDKEYKCQNCEINFTPNWLDKRPPITPVKLKKEDLWAFPTTTYASCPSCESQVPIDLPKGSFGQDFYFFADEAYRDFGEQYLVNYSLIGVKKSHYHELANIVSHWKYLIYKKNGSQPLDVAHLTDLWSKKVRNKMPGAENLSKEDVIEFYSDLACKLGKNDNIKIYSCSALLNKDKDGFRKQLQVFKEFVTFNLFNISIQESTRSGFIPIFFFEDDGKMGWLFDMFERMRLTLMFPFICTGKPVPEPRIIRKHRGQEFLAGIEAADFICFSSARSAHNLYHNQSLDFNMELLGDVAYIQFNKRGDVVLKRKIGYPGISA